DSPGQLPVELPRGQSGLKGCLSLDQVANCLSLGEVDSTIEERAHGELARFGQTRAEGKRVFDQPGQDDRTAMTGDLDDIFTCVRPGRFEKGQDRGIQGFPRFNVEDMTNNRMIRLEVYCRWLGIGLGGGDDAEQAAGYGYC